MSYMSIYKFIYVAQHLYRNQNNITNQSVRSILHDFCTILRNLKKYPMGALHA